MQEEVDEETEPNRGRISAITDILLNVGGIYEIRYKKLKVAPPDHPIYKGKYQVYPVNSLEDYKNKGRKGRVEEHLS